MANPSQPITENENFRVNLAKFIKEKHDALMNDRINYNIFYISLKKGDCGNLESTEFPINNSGPISIIRQFVKPDDSYIRNLITLNSRFNPPNPGEDESKSGDE